MDKREKEYVQSIAQEIRRAKRGTLFFGEGASRNADLTMLLEALSTRRDRKELQLLEKEKRPIIARNEAEARRLLEKSAKGAVIVWKDTDGMNHILLNMGANKNGKIQAIAFKGQLDKKTLNVFMKTARTEVLAADIKRVYDRLYRRQEQRLKRKPIEKLFPFERKRESGSSFEARFKDVVRSLGSASSPLHTAQVMVSTMNQSQKQELSKQFAANGVKTAKDLTALLSKWQEEALQEPEYRRKPRMELRHERKRKRTSYAYER